MTGVSDIIDVADVKDLQELRRALFDRSTSTDREVRALVTAMIARVKRDGDEALRQMARELDGIDLDTMEVSQDVCAAALEALEPRLRNAMERAARNIAAAHSVPFAPYEIETEPGVVVGRRPDPLRRVGIYAPGGRAAYPSSLLMCAVPARLAGVAEIVVCTPRPTPVILAAAALAKVDRVFTIGGAGAIAALAFGTESVPRVDKIVGPGNAYVAEAKLQLCGSVAIDSPAGPSEVLIIADDSADQDVIRREALAQLEHDLRAVAVIVLVGDRTWSDEPGAGEAGGAGRSTLLRAKSVENAVAFSNAYAPEHLLLAVREPERALTLVRNAGTVFLGETSSVAFGDYMTGSNHVLPTGGLARSYSGLSILDFVRWTTYQRVTRDAAAGLAADVAIFAQAEGLPAHAAAASYWIEERV